ncbi:MAG: DHH family phosphoesterase [Eggerthellaceae bacterium]|nr:DHH family phosphoesterase [Eggerthellaceae bacterium]
MVTPQTNTTLEEIADVLRTRDDFVICGHISPDGDCLGSQLALWHALRALGKNAVCLLAKDEPIDDKLSYLPGIEALVPASRFEGSARTFIAVDAPLPERLGADAWAIRQRCEFSVTVDHHAVPETMSDLNYVDPDAAATALLVWRLTDLLGVDRSGSVALCAYTGLVTDTGRFQFQNTDAETFSAASEMVSAGADPARVACEVFQNRSIASVQLEGIALSRMRFGCDGRTVMSWVSLEDFKRCNAVKADAETLVNTLRSIKGVRVACMLREQADGVRGSFRAKDDTDVTLLARPLGGGGHKAAAGFTLEESIESAVRRISVLLGCDEGEEGAVQALFAQIEDAKR